MFVCALRKRLVCSNLAHLRVLFKGRLLDNNQEVVKAKMVASQLGCGRRSHERIAGRVEKGSGLLNNRPELLSKSTANLQTSRSPTRRRVAVSAAETEERFSGLSGCPQNPNAIQNFEKDRSGHLLEDLHPTRPSKSSPSTVITLLSTMIRRRTTATSTPDADDSKHRKARLAPPSSAPTVSHRLVVGLVALLLAIGILQNHFRQSRSRDPFAPRPRPKNLQQKSLLTKEEDANLERDADGTRYHVVFSTDCSPYQHWQSYLVYYTAMKVKQPGHVTRIASGCDPAEAAAMERWFQDDVQFLSNRFHLQLTPAFSQVKNEKGEIVGDYKFFNKPFGLRYWMEHSPQLGYANGAFPANVEDDVVILIDPDMGLLRPLTKDFSDPRETIVSARRQEHRITDKVKRGKPAAQVYGFGAQWQRLDLEKIAGVGTPAKNYTGAEGLLFFPVGPPYIGTVVDMHAIANKWSEFVPGVYEQYPHLLAEMFAFCIAAAHLQLPFQLIDSLMISDVGSGAEGWAHVDKIPPAEVCDFARDPDHGKYAIPSVVHLCQRYAAGQDWFFGKRAMPSDVYDCETPLFAEPPADLATAFDYKWPPKGHKQNMSPKEAVRESFLLCYLYRLMNDAATFYKQNSCEPSTINLKKERSLAKYMLEKK